MYCIRKTKHNTLCLVPDSEADEGEDKQDPSKPLEYWLSTGYREVVLHVSKRTHRIINERTRCEAGRGNSNRCNHRRSVRASHLQPKNFFHRTFSQNKFLRSEMSL